MAVSATFVADFNSFLSQAKAAEASLENLATAAGLTEKQIDKVAHSFKGESIIASATKVTMAVEGIGGASKLTESEMARVNRTLTEALAKMQLMGVQAPADMVRLADATKKVDIAAKDATHSTSAFSSTFAALTASFSAGMIINNVITSLSSFARGAIESAGNLVDLRAATGVSLEMLQRWQLVAEQGGIELEKLTTASFKLGNAISTGKGSTREAVDALGVSWQHLKSLQPDQQLDLILKSAEALGPSQERNAALVELFGSKGAIALARIVEGYAEIGSSANVAADKQVEAVDRAADAWSKFQRDISAAFVQTMGNIVRGFTESGVAVESLTAQEYQTYLMLRKVGGEHQYLIQLADQRAAAEEKAAAAAATTNTQAITAQRNYRTELAETIAEVNKIDAETRKQIKAAQDLGVTQDELTERYGLSEAALRLLTQQERESEQEKKKLANQSAEVSAQVERLTKSLTDQIAAHEKLQQSVGKVAPTYESFRIPVAQLVTDMPLLSSSLADAAKRTTEADAEALKWARTNGVTLAPALKSTSESTKAIAREASNLSAAWSKAGATIVQAVAGGGNAIKALGASLGSAFGEDIGKKIATNITGPLGQALGSAMGPLGAMAGSLLGEGMSKALGWVKGLFGGGDKTQNLLAAQAEAAKKAQEELNKQLEESKTKLEGMRTSLSGMQTELDGLIGKAYEMGYVFNQQGQLTGFNFQKVAQVAKDFGVDLAALGPAFQQAQLTAEAQRVIDAFTLLTMSGADVGGVLVGMKDEINKIVNDSLKFGTVIPDNMKPWIAELIRTGQLTDANGQKITDISQIKFGQPVKSEYEKINSAIETVVNAMNNLLGQISSLVASIERLTADRTMVVRAQYEDPGPPEGFGDPTRGRSGSGGGSEPEFATGTMGQFGRWFANFGSGTRAVLHGNEAVVRADQAAAFAADMGGGGNGAMAAEIAGLRADMNALLPRAIGRAVRDAMQLSGAMA